MKRLISLLLLILVLTLCCGAFAEEAPSEQAADALVDVVLPAVLYEGMTEEEIAAVAEESGFAGYTINEDGTIGFTLSKNLQTQLLDAYELGLVESMAAYLYGEQRVPCFISITPSADYRQFDVVIDQDSYTGMEYMCGVTFLYGASFYQHFSGLPVDEVEVVVSFIDSKTEEVVQSIAYSDLF